MVRTAFVAGSIHGPWKVRPDAKYRLNDNLSQPGELKGNERELDRAYPMSRVYGDWTEHSKLGGVRRDPAPSAAAAFGVKPSKTKNFDHQLNPYRFALKEAGIAVGEPYVHPVFGFLTPWAHPSQVVWCWSPSRRRCLRH